MQGMWENHYYDDDERWDTVASGSWKDDTKEKEAEIKRERLLKERREIKRRSRELYKRR